MRPINLLFPRTFLVEAFGSPIFWDSPGSGQRGMVGHLDDLHLLYKPPASAAFRDHVVQLPETHYGGLTVSTDTLERPCPSQRRERIPVAPVAWSTLATLRGGSPLPLARTEHGGVEGEETDVMEMRRSRGLQVNEIKARRKGSQGRCSEGRERGRGSNRGHISKQMGSCHGQLWSRFQ